MNQLETQKLKLKLEKTSLTHQTTYASHLDPTAFQ